MERHSNHKRRCKHRRCAVRRSRGLKATVTQERFDVVFPASDSINSPFYLLEAAAGNTTGTNSCGSRGKISS